MSAHIVSENVSSPKLLASSQIQQSELVEDTRTARSLIIIAVVK